MFKGLKKRLAKKTQDKRMYDQMYKRELESRKKEEFVKAAKLKARKDARLQAKSYAERRGGGLGSRMTAGLDKFGKDMLSNIDPNPAGANGFVLDPFPQDPMRKRKR